jgi:predicted GTPase
MVVYGGVDYEAILRQTEQGTDVILWDGGNNDAPFYRSDLEIAVADPHRAGHELGYNPGEDKPSLRVGYEIVERSKPGFAKILADFAAHHEWCRKTRIA